MSRISENSSACTTGQCGNCSECGEPAIKDITLGLLTLRWNKKPTQRFGQLFVNLIKETYPALVVPKIFYLTDEDLIMMLMRNN